MLRTRKLFLIVLPLIIAGSAFAQEKGPIIRLDPALDDIVSPDAKVEKVAGGFVFFEGPLWVRKGGYLLFSDIANNVIEKWNPADGKVTPFLDRPDSEFKSDGSSMLGGPNGNTMDSQ